MTDANPLIAGRYRLVETLAIGGMGVVWEAWDERLLRPVAIKQLRVQPGLRPDEAATARNRAMREARNTARLHHPHAVPVYDVVEHDGEPCLIMEYLPSMSLQEAIRQRGPLPPAEVARIGSELAQALGAAHRVGIVHRDVKPGNVLLAEDGTTKLTDFGISHALGDTTLTATGMLTGTPAYLAPEVARGAPASFASDMFSLGSTLYAATEGQPPFGQEDNAMAVLHRVASGRMRPPQRSGPITPLLLRMLSIDPRARPSMADVTQALAAVPTAGGGSRPLSSLTTTRLQNSRAAPPPPPKAAPATLTDARPARPPASRPPRGRRGLLVAAVAGVLAVAAVLVAFALTRHGTGGSPGNQAGGSSTRAAAGPATHAVGTSSSATHPSSTHPSSTGAPSTRASTTAGGSGEAGTATELAQAITDYYGLLPGNLQEGWARLTPSYQRASAGTFGAYQTFWGQFKQVLVSDVTGQAPDSAQASITYVYKDGHRTSERRTFTLVRSGGRRLINTSSTF